MANVQSSKSGGQWFTALLTLAAGVFLIMFHNHLDLITWIVAAMGWLILLWGVYLVAVNVVRSRQTRDVWQVIVGVLALALGIWVAAAPSTFSHLLIYIFAIVLILAGAWHVFSLRVIGHDINVPIYFYVIPALLIVAGVCFFITGAKVVTTAIILVMGIALVCSAAATLMELFGRRRDRRLHSGEATDNPTLS